MVVVVQLEGLMGFPRLISHYHINIKVINLLVKFFVLLSSTNTDNFTILFHIFDNFWRNIFDFEDRANANIFGTLRSMVENIDVVLLICSYRLEVLGVDFLHVREDLGLWARNYTKIS